MKNIFHLLLSLALVSVLGAQTVYPPVQRSTLLVSGRIPVVGPNGIVTDSSSLTFSGSTLTTGTVVGALSGNATTATTLATPRAINGVNFDGSAAITVPAASVTLTGTTLASNVVTSSLTGVGTITAGVWQATPVGDSYIASALTGKSYNGVTTSGSGTLANSGTSSLTGFTGSGSSSGTNTGDQDLSGYATLAGNNTFTGSNTISGKPLTISGNQSAAAWTTTGTGLVLPSASYTDTSSSGTVAVTGIHSINAPTLLASSATTYTNSAALLLRGSPVASTNVTQTNAYPLYIDNSAAQDRNGMGLQVGSDPVTLSNYLSAAQCNLRTIRTYSSGNINQRGIQSYVEWQGTSSSTSLATGLSALVFTASTASGALTSATGQTGISGSVTHGGTGNIALAVAVKGAVTTTGSNNSPITDAAAFYATAPTVNSSSTFGTYQGLWVPGGGVSGTITTRYGVRVDTFTLGTGTNAWGFYDAGNPNYFGGRLQIGSTTNHSSEQLQVTGTAYVSGASTLAGGIVGTATNNNATAGNVGEYVSSLVASGSAVSLTTATDANVTSISLTAGDWDVSGNINFAASTATVTGTSGGITTTSATVPTDGSEVFSGVQVTLTSENDSVTIPSTRMSLSGTTTVYLVGKSTFSAGTVAAFGKISARRVR